jgi:uncharacterized lipoprotein YddW (UPF0748 family)
MWVTAWNMTTPKNIDSVFAVAKRYDFNQIFVQTRYRGDAMYVPNRFDSTFTNTEKRSYLLEGSNFDPLAYCIKKGKQDSIEVHAWVTVFVITPHNLQKINDQHLFHTQNDWITTNKKGRPMPHNSLEGAYVDPAITRMRAYTINVLSDIAMNYQIDGLQLDYVRYPDSIYGYHKESLSKFELSGMKNFEDWKRRQVSGFVNLTYIQLKNIRPELQISAAVKSDYLDAYHRYSQDWKTWLDERYIDKVYLMAYTQSTEKLKSTMQHNLDVKNKNKVVVGLRAWSDRKPYPAFKINEKIITLKQQGFDNLGFYSYGGMMQNDYLKYIRFE